MAAKIREVAGEHRVPILEAPPLARALYRHGEIGRDIPWQLYESRGAGVAWVMAAARRPSGTSAAQAAVRPAVPADWACRTQPRLTRQVQTQRERNQARN